MRRISLFLLLTILTLILSGMPVFAESKIVPYSAEALQKAQEEGGESLIEFYASWCPTCWRQHSSLKKVSNDSKFEKVTFFEADYDDSDELKNKFGVSRQSTLIIVKGDKEIARLSGVTGEEEISNFISNSISK